MSARKTHKVVSWRRRVKRLLIEYKGGRCIQCGYDKDCPPSYAFHHRDPNQKDLAISGKSWSYERLKAEADKCDLLCVRCHTELHYKWQSEKDDNTWERYKKKTSEQKQIKLIDTICQTCQKQYKPKNDGQKYCCVECYRIGSRKCERPNKEILIKQLECASVSAIGRIYGVSDNTIRKWLKQTGR